MSKVEVSVLHVHVIAAELKVSTKQVEATIELLDEGATVPFISRYRKEITGSMDEVQIAAVRDRFEQLRDLDKRRESILKSINEQGKLTPELEEKIKVAGTMTELEDIYLPYKQKRKTRASIAKEKGLEPLALLMLEQSSIDLEAEAAKYIDTEKGVATFEEALSGARDIVAETINEDQAARTSVRRLFNEKGTIKSRVFPGKENEGQKYRDYFEWEEPIGKTPSHRLLAMRRGEKEGFLMLDIAPLEEDAIDVIERQFIIVQGRTVAADQMKLAVKDAYKRLLKPSMETEVRMGTKTKADVEAIRVFSDNLKELLLSSPLGQKNVLALDPGFRSGCKLVCLDRQGKLLEETVVYPHEPQRQTQQSAAVIMALCQKHSIEAISIGNGTAGRETETFVKTLGLPKEILIVMVNESGASVYSASDVAREEFPTYDVTVRGAVSIGRRLMDPLAELVKIDPKAIGVGQYQHDVDQTALKKSLDEVVISSVNLVGVEVNTASKQLLTYVSGLGPQLAQNIIDYRNANGPFKSRSDIKKVARMGDKAFEQSAGFLRVQDAENPLDRSAVHPESYPVVERMAKDVGASVMDIMNSKELRQKIVLKNYVSETVGLPTLQDIFQELDKPGRDPRKNFELFEFAEGVKEMKDLRPGMKLPGIITNVTKFGVFVDIGVHQDGLIHISHLADRFISDPSEVVKVQQKVQVTVLEVDEARKRISLSMKGDAGAVSKPKGQAAAGAKKEKEAEGDMQSKLNMLISKFK
ncbi:Tex family protein [uncultured Cytophaga sp.]|uniref:Tex family protein n=1 Tax=uncultured Cytophaga sp. TaxID=160238 RepID=UPI002620FAB3|nr:Tex family protein [uncultured Cytophaga sp.]